MNLEQTCLPQVVEDECLNPDWIVLIFAPRLPPHPRPPDAARPCHHQHHHLDDAVKKESCWSYCCQSYYHQHCLRLLLSFVFSSWKVLVVDLGPPALHLLPPSVSLHLFLLSLTRRRKRKMRMLTISPALVVDEDDHWLLLLVLLLMIRIRMPSSQGHPHR